MYIYYINNDYINMFYWIYFLLFNQVQIAIHQKTDILYEYLIQNFKSKKGSILIFINNIIFNIWFLFYAKHSISKINSK